MTSELKPCPFCGGEATLQEDAQGYSSVSCFNEGCIEQVTTGWYRYAKQEAIAAWNQRATPIPDTPEMVRALDDAYEAGIKSAERTCKREKITVTNSFFDCEYTKEYEVDGCPYCEIPLADSWSYCPECGAKVVW